MRKIAAIAFYNKEAAAGREPFRYPRPLIIARSSDYCFRRLIAPRVPSTAAT
jgi:hypothetical protein